MDSLPDAVIGYILSHLKNARDLAACKCVSKRWKDSIPYLKTLYFPRNAFDNYSGNDSPDNIVRNMVASVTRLEELVVYNPFSSAGLASWLFHAGSTLKHLELRIDNLSETEACLHYPSKLDCINKAMDLESLKLWGVLMVSSPRWGVFKSLHNLEIVGARLKDDALFDALRACPNLTSLLLLGCEGLKVVMIDMPYLEKCKLDFYGPGDCSLSFKCPKIESLDIQGCSWIRVQDTECLRTLSISNNAGNFHLLAITY